MNPLPEKFKVRHRLSRSTPFWALFSYCVISFFASRALVAQPIPSNSFIPTIDIIDSGELKDRCFISPEYEKLSPQQPCQLNDALNFVAKERATAATEKKQFILIAFVHGWLHGSKESDSNLVDFTKKIQELNAEATARGKKLHYSGVYVSWRGETLRGPAEYLTFWGRERGAERAGSVAMTETLLRLRNKTWDGDNPGRFLIFGHSFGGLIVQQVTVNMLTASLLLNPHENATPCNMHGGRPADLIVLINPAVDSILAEEFIDVLRRSETLPCALKGLSDGVKAPLLISIRSRTDGDTGRVFIGGHWLELMGQHMDKENSNCVFCMPPVQSGTDKVWMGQTGFGERAKFLATTGQLPYFHNFCYLDENFVGEDLCADIKDRVLEARNGAQKEYMGETIDDIKLRVLRTSNIPELAGVDPKLGAWELTQKVPSDKRIAFKNDLVKALGPHLVFADTAAQVDDPGLILNLYCRAESCADEHHLWNDTPYWIFTVPDHVISGHSDFWEGKDFTAFMESTASGLFN